jgi:hypothetical protein
MVLTLMYNTLNYCVFGLRPLPRILETIKHNKWKLDLFSFSGGGLMHLLCWFLKKN